MEFFNLSASPPPSAQRLSLEVVQAMVRDLSAGVQQRLMMGEMLSARVLESTPKSLQIELAGRQYTVTSSEGRLPNLSGMITLRYHAPRTESGEKTLTHSRNTPVQIRTDTGSAPRPVVSTQSQGVATTHTPQATSQTLPVSVHGLLVRAEMLRPVSQATPVSPVQAVSPASVQSVQQTAPVLSTTPQNIQTGASLGQQTLNAASTVGQQNPDVRQPPVVTQQVQVKTSTSSVITTTRQAQSPDRAAPQVTANAQGVGSEKNTHTQINPTQSRNTPAFSAQNPSKQVSERTNLTSMVQSATSSSALGEASTAASRQRTTAPVAQSVSVQKPVLNQSVQTPSAQSSVPNSVTKPDVFQASIPKPVTSAPIASVSETKITSGSNPLLTPVATKAVSSGVSGAPSIQTAGVKPQSAAVQAVGSTPQSTPVQVQTQALQPTVTTLAATSNATPSTVSAPVQSSADRIIQPTVVSSAPEKVTITQTRTGNRTTIDQSTQQSVQNSTISEAKNPLLARFTRSYQQVQQQIGAHSPAQGVSLAQWTKTGQSIQLHIHDPRLAPRNIPQIQGTVVLSDQTGKTVLNTAKGQIALQLPRAIPQGVEVILSEPASVHSAAGRLRFHALETLLSATSAPIANMVKAGLPQPNAHMSHTMLFFLLALRQNSTLQSWWGSSIQQEMQPGAEKLNAAEEEFQQAAPAPLATDSSWQSYSLPLQVGEEVVKLLFYWRGGRQKEEDSENADTNIFAVEGYHHDIGRFRLDGQFLHRQLNLQWASDRPLNPEVERGLMRLYQQHSERYNISGQFQFQLLGDRHLWMDGDGTQGSVQV